MPMPQKVVLTEQQLSEKIHQAFAGTEVTYKQIECELDEQGYITIFFSIWIRKREETMSKQVLYAEIG